MSKLNEELYRAAVVFFAVGQSVQKREKAEANLRRATAKISAARKRERILKG